MTSSHFSFSLSSQYEVARSRRPTCRGRGRWEEWVGGRVWEEWVGESVGEVDGWECGRSGWVRVWER